MLQWVQQDFHKVSMRFFWKLHAQTYFCDLQNQSDILSVVWSEVVQFTLNISYDTSNFTQLLMKFEVSTFDTYSMFVNHILIFNPIYIYMVMQLFIWL